MKAVKQLYHEIDAEDMQVANEDTSYTDVGSDYAGIKQRWLLVLHEPSRQRQDANLKNRHASWSC